MNKKVIIFAIAKDKCVLILEIINKELVKIYAYRNVSKGSPTRKEHDNNCFI